MPRRSTPNLPVSPTPEESVWDEAQIQPIEDDVKKLKAENEELRSKLENVISGHAIQEDPGRKRGRKSTKDWDLITAFLLGQISRTEPNQLDNESQLKNYVADFLQNNINYVPPDERLAAKIRTILRRMGF